MPTKSHTSPRYLPSGLKITTDSQTENVATRPKRAEIGIDLPFPIGIENEILKGLSRSG
jgi:hypothetical protein